MWETWEEACTEGNAPCVGDFTVGAQEGWTSLIVLRDPQNRLAAAYRKLCPRTDEGAIPEGYENTCPLFHGDRPRTFDVWVQVCAQSSMRVLTDSTFHLRDSTPSSSFTTVAKRDRLNSMGEPSVTDTLPASANSCRINRCRSAHCCYTCPRALGTLQAMVAARAELGGKDDPLMLNSKLWPQVTACGSAPST